MCIAFGIMNLYPLKMRFFRIFVVILILVPWALSLGSDLLSKEGHPKIEQSLSFKFNDNLSSVTSNIAERDCSDLCHDGICHFGHCSHTILQKTFSFTSVNAKTTEMIFLKSFFSSPDLDTPLRPPKSA